MSDSPRHATPCAYQAWAHGVQGGQSGQGGEGGQGSHGGQCGLGGQGGRCSREALLEPIWLRRRVTVRVCVCGCVYVRVCVSVCTCVRACMNYSLRAYGQIS